MVTVTPIALLEPSAPTWAQRFAQNIAKTYLALFPQAPVRLWSVLEANLPPAAAWAGCIVFVSDKAKVGLSNGTSWTTTTGGAL